MDVMNNLNVCHNVGLNESGAYIFFYSKSILLIVDLHVLKELFYTHFQIDLFHPGFQWSSLV